MVVEVLRRLDALELAGVGNHLRALIQATHLGTWFVLDGFPDCARALSGLLAGDPLGDVVFKDAFMRVCYAMRDRKLQAGCVVQVVFAPVVPCWRTSEGSGDQPALVDGSYLDDFVYFSEAPYPVRGPRSRGDAGLHHLRRDALACPLAPPAAWKDRGPLVPCRRRYGLGSSPRPGGSRHQLPFAGPRRLRALHCRLLQAHLLHVPAGCLHCL